MGVTHYEIPILKKLIAERNIKSVVELGAQQQYTEQHYGRYMSDWYKEAGIQIYRSIDLNGENLAYTIDLSKEISKEQLEFFYVHTEPFNCHDLVTDFGTSEHVSDDGNSYGTGKFSWEAIYNCWKNKFNLCALGGWIFSVNPKTGNWPGHGFNYYSLEFYTDLSNHSGLTILSLDYNAAMGNEIDGWNISCIMHKNTELFPTLEEFKIFDLRRV